MKKKKISDINDKDFEIVKKAKTGDRDALGELYLRHAQKVRRLLAGIVGPNSEIDDLVQEVFIQVQGSLPRFRGEAKFTTWLHQLTVYAAYNYFRKPKGRFIPTDPSIMSTYFGDDKRTAYEKLVSDETMKRVYEVTSRIKPKKRIAFLLYAINGMSAREVAKITKTAVPTAKSRIWFARRELLKIARHEPYLKSLLEELA